MPTPQELDGELARMRHTFRMAVIAAAVGATVGAGAVITVVGAVFSVMSGPTSETQKAPPNRVERAKIPSAADTARAQRAEEQARSRTDSCQNQTWPYVDSKCATKVEAPNEAAAATAPASPTVAEQPSTTAGSTTGAAPANAAPPPSVVPATVTPTNSTATTQPPANAAAAPPPAPAVTPVAAPQPQPQPQVNPEPAAAVAAAPSAPKPEETSVPSEKQRKKSGDSRRERRDAQQKAASTEGNRHRNDASRAAREQAAQAAAQESAIRDSSNRESRDREARDREARDRESWGRNSRADEERGVDNEYRERPPTRTFGRSRGDDDARSDVPVVVVPRTRQRVPIETTAQAPEQPAVATKKQRRARPQSQPQEATEEIHEAPSEGGRGFLGGLFGPRED